MSKSEHTFPWGIYIGDLIGGRDFLPVCLDSEQGGFCVVFDDESEKIANNFIENVALKLFEVLPVGDIETDIFDFTRKKRFMYLSSLQNEKLYNISLGSNDAVNAFNKLDQIALHRHHELLSFDTATISEYNQKNKFTQRYHLLLINLEHYPDDLSAYRKIKEFFESANEAGFYTIAFGNRAVFETKIRSVKYLLNKFPLIEIKEKQFSFSKELFAFADSLESMDFDYANDDKKSIVDKIIKQLHADNEKDGRKDFLSVSIGKSLDGRKDIKFTLGEKSGNYHAFITGVTRSGKSTLLNNIIIDIAKNYTADDIRLYLMDYKEGVEFQVFKNHPNCEKIFLDNEDFEASVNLLQEFVKKIEERSKIFKAKGNEINSISAYNRLHPDRPMQRLILIIDEVHKLFAGEYKNKALFNSLLEVVVRQGGAYGIHIILSTQTLTGMDIDAQIMLQITYRLSFKLTSERDSERIFTFGNTEAFNLDMKAYEFIINNDSGRKEANVLARANPPQDIKSTIEEIRKERDKSLMITPTIVKSKSKSQEKDMHKAKESKREPTKYETSVDDDKEFLRSIGFDKF